jgi:branched-chain amino acid transport system substrate-binding protein
LLPAAHLEGCLDYYQNVGDPFSKTLLDRYNSRYPGQEQLKLWEAAVKEAGSLRQEDFIAALDHARGQHHVRMNMYIAQAKNGHFEIVESLGAIDPDQAMVPSALEFRQGPIRSQPVGWSA